MTYESLPFLFLFFGICLIIPFVLTDRLWVKKQEIKVKVLEIHRHPESYAFVELEKKPVRVSISPLYGSYLSTGFKQEIGVIILRGRFSGYLYKIEAD